MSHPAFFDSLPPITMQDDLVRLLGASSDGIFCYSYQDIVKLAGHSCPTTAGAYLMLRKGLSTLYPDSRPKRGEIKVQLKESAAVNATGVIAAIASLITGAADEKGFRGLGGQYARNGLLAFESKVPMAMRLIRTDTNEWVDIAYDPSSVPADASLSMLMKKVGSLQANSEELRRFGELWQKRVEAIMLSGSVVEVQKGS